MTKFGGSTFTNCSVPLAFGKRYFIIEPGTPPSFSVVFDNNGSPVFEIHKNKPSENPVSEVSISAAKIVTVSDKNTGKFLYKFRPESETSIVFGKIDGGEITATISDKRIQVGGMTVENCSFNGCGAGIVVAENGGVGIGAPIPPSLLQLFQK